MERFISKRNTVKASTAKPLGKPPPGYKSLGLDTDIWFYELKYGDNTEEGEDEEIFIVQDKSLAETKQNLSKRNFPYINMFDHQGRTVVCSMYDLTSGVFKHLETTYLLDVDKRVN